MNWEHLKAFLWLRWRIISNRNKRSGKGAVILQAIFTAFMFAGGFISFALGITAGYFGLPRASSAVFLYVWNGVVIAFLFMWMIELLIELQRSELMSLEKFLHLPVSLSGAFLINYLGSISGLGAVMILPLMIGLSIGLVFAKGAIMLLLFPLIAAFALMVTALTHQFRGWLASLMMNKRRRRTVIMITTFLFMGMTQIPNIIAFTSGRWGSRPGTAMSEATRKELDKLNVALAKKEITREEHRVKRDILRAPGRAEDARQLYQIVRYVNTIIPLGWLPYGAVEGFEGSPWPALLGIAGLSVIGIVSLRRSYVTTLQLYTGKFTAGGAAPTATPAAVAPRETATGPPKKYPAALLEKKFPRVSEYASVVAVASFRSLMRAPEAKMMLLSPVIMLFVFGSFLFRGGEMPELTKPLVAAGGHAFMLFMIVGVLGNQFGFDRSAFRVFVLSPAPRRDILLGKNMAAAPLGIGFMFIGALLIQMMSPMRVDHYLAVLLQMIPMYLLFSLVGNILSIIAPMPMALGSMKPVKPKAKTLLIHLGFVLVFPIALAPTLIPLGIELLLGWTTSYSWFPAYFLLTIVEVALVGWLYIEAIDAQGRLFERREQKILEVVTSKVE